jgi:hypothetical protein
MKLIGNGTKRKGGNKLNMIIAKTHRLSSRLVGMQLTSGNLIGVILSMCQMSLGFVFLTASMTHGVWYMVGMVVLIGCALAILIERLSIGGLSSVREATNDKRKIEDRFYADAIVREPSEWEVQNKDRQVKAFNRDIKAGWMFGSVGMVLSTLIGDIFWHQIFEPMGAWYIVFPMSLACACVIGLTFVHSELFKDLLDRVLAAILRDLHLMKAAVATEEQNMQLDMMVSAMDDVRNDDAVRDPIETKIGKVVVKRLGGFADNISDVTLGDGGRVVESGNSGNGSQIQIQAPRGQYHVHKDELRRLLAANPTMSVGQLAQHFGKSKSTMADWLNKSRAGL